MMIKIQKKDFNIENEIKLIKDNLNNVGAVSTFVGFVRNENANKKVFSIDLEVYESMAKKYLKELILNTNNKWNLLDSLVIHRYGRLYVNEKIVLVATFSKHRKESYEACNFIMDYLKKDAPFWKKENYKKSSNWIENTFKTNLHNQ